VSEKPHLWITVCTLKKLAEKLLTMPPQALAKALEAGEVTEVNCNA
jgi:hypothetical protein